MNVDMQRASMMAGVIIFPYSPGRPQRAFADGSTRYGIETPGRQKDNGFPPVNGAP
jgi:hypothetical protein